MALNRRKMLRHSQKGLMFTLLTIILFVLMLAEVITYVVINNTYNQQASEAAAVVGADSLATTLKGALSQFLVSGMGRAIEVYVPAGSMLQYPLNSTEAGALSSLLYNGVAEGTYYTGMGNATILDFTSAMEKQASAQSSDMVISNSSITVYQDSPEYINISYTGMATINTTYGFFTYPLSTDVGYPTMLSYVNITLQNAQLASTTAPFQQVITFNPTAYGSYEGADLGNIRFYHGATELYSWCESGCSSSSTSATFWVSLPGGIPADSNTIITMGFLPKNVEYSMAYRSSIAVAHAGEAPQLSPTYAEYDNGANVFLSYLPGASLTGWTTAGTAGQLASAPSGNPTFGTNAFYANGAKGDYLYTQAPAQSGNMIMEFYGYTANLQDLFFLASSSGVGQMMRDGNGGGWYGLASTSSWTSWAAPPDTGIWSNEWVTIGVVVDGGTATGYLSSGVNTYGSEIGSNPTNQYAVTNDGTYLGLVGDGAGGSQYWSGIIVRAYPPSGVMPSASFSSVIRTT